MSVRLSSSGVGPLAGGTQETASPELVVTELVVTTAAKVRNVSENGISKTGLLRGSRELLTVVRVRRPFVCFGRILLQ